MTCVDRSIGFGKTRKNGPGLAALWRFLVAPFTGYRARRHMSHFNGINDYQLADIGLTRCDLADISRGRAMDRHCSGHSRAAQIRRIQLYML